MLQPSFFYTNLMLLKTSKWLSKLKFLDNPLANLLYLDVVDDRVHKRWNQQVHIRHQMYRTWQMLPKAVHQRQANHGDIEEQHSTDVGDTGVEGPEALLAGGNAQHSAEDESIGEEDEQGIHPHSAGHNKEPIDVIDNDARAGQLHDL